MPFVKPALLAGIVLFNNNCIIFRQYLLTVTKKCDIYIYVNLIREKVVTIRGNGMQNNYRKGCASLVILSLLRREDMYGYQLVQETAKSSGGRLTTQEGSLYPVLYRLVEQGYISDRRVLSGQRMTRVYYHLEPAGLEHLNKLIEDYTNVTEGVFQIIRSGEGEAEA